jgi:hypothetical protein
LIELRQSDFWKGFLDAVRRSGVQLAGHGQGNPTRRFFLTWSEEGRGDMANKFDTDLDKCKTKYQQLTPLGLLDRAAEVNRTATSPALPSAT